MRIHRSHPDSNFTIMPNETLQDERLSFVALGILCQLVSRPDGWSITADTLWQQTKRRQGKKSGQGREAIRAAFAELEKYGYLVRRRTKDEYGQFITVLELHNTPGHHAGELGASIGGHEGEDGGGADSPDHSADRRTELRASELRASENVASETRASENLASLQSTDTQRTELQSIEDKHSSALADARAAAATAAARERIEAELNGFQEAAKQLPDADLRNFMLKLEQRRPRVYRQCRQEADSWLQEEYPNLLRANKRAAFMDQVTYMYALIHYMPKPPEKCEWDAWVIRPLKEHAQAVEAA